MAQTKEEHLTRGRGVYALIIPACEFTCGMCIEEMESVFGATPNASGFFRKDRGIAVEHDAAVVSVEQLPDILLAAWLFTRIYRHVVRTGLIPRYSAETLS